MRVDRRLMTLYVVGLGLLLFLALSMPSTALGATTVTVSTTSDTVVGDGVCSLREATLYANGTAEPDCAVTPPSGATTIVVPAGTYALAGLPLTLTGNAAISGAGAATTTITAGGQSQVLLVKQSASASV